jgi:hypothetical protein
VPVVPPAESTIGLKAVLAGVECFLLCLNLWRIASLWPLFQLEKPPELAFTLLSEDHCTMYV